MGKKHLRLCRRRGIERSLAGRLAEIIRAWKSNAKVSSSGFTNTFYQHKSKSLTPPEDPENATKLDGAHKAFRV